MQWGELKKKFENMPDETVVCIETDSGRCEPVDFALEKNVRYIPPGAFSNGYYRVSIVNVEPKAIVLYRD